MKKTFLKKFITCGLSITTLCAVTSIAKAQQDFPTPNSTTETSSNQNKTVTQTITYNQNNQIDSNLDFEDSVDEFSKRTRKGCLEDFRQCAKLVIDSKDDGRGSNAKACERWKTVCPMHYPAIFKTIDETTAWIIISKKDYEQYQKLKEENRVRVTVEKDGNKTITTKIEIDDQGNEKVTTTVETIEEVYENPQQNSNPKIQIYQPEPSQNVAEEEYTDDEEIIEDDDEEISIVAG